MGLLRMAAKAGLAKKIWDEARKPQNQAKAREVFAKLTDKGGARQTTTARGQARDATSRRTRRP